MMGLGLHNYQSTTIIAAAFNLFPEVHLKNYLYMRSFNGLILHFPIENLAGLAWYIESGATSC